MKIVRNGFIPFKGFTAINLFGILFVRDDSFLDGIAINHELIHTQQMRELLYIPFYACYVAEWLVRLVLPGNAYRNISFEREAFTCQTDLSYTGHRKPYAWLNYMIK